MESLKELLSVKGAKVKLQFSRKEREFFELEAGFTDEELEIFRLRTRGFSITAIAMEMTDKHDKYFSKSTIESRIRSIKQKILAVI